MQSKQLRNGSLKLWIFSVLLGLFLGVDAAGYYSGYGSYGSYGTYTTYGTSPSPTSTPNYGTSPSPTSTPNYATSDSTSSSPSPSTSPTSSPSPTTSPSPSPSPTPSPTYASSPPISTPVQYGFDPIESSNSVQGAALNSGPLKDCKIEYTADVLTADVDATNGAYSIVQAALPVDMVMTSVNCTDTFTGLMLPMKVKFMSGVLNSQANVCPLSTLGDAVYDKMEMDNVKGANWSGALDVASVLLNISSVISASNISSVNYVQLAAQPGTEKFMGFVLLASNAQVMNVATLCSALLAGLENNGQNLGIAQDVAFYKVLEGMYVNTASGSEFNSTDFTSILKLMEYAFNEVLNSATPARKRSLQQTYVFTEYESVATLAATAAADANAVLVVIQQQAVYVTALVQQDPSSVTAADLASLDSNSLIELAKVSKAVQGEVATSAGALGGANETELAAFLSSYTGDGLTNSINSQTLDEDLINSIIDQFQEQNNTNGGPTGNPEPTTEKSGGLGAGAIAGIAVGAAGGAAALGAGAFLAMKRGGGGAKAQMLP